MPVVWVVAELETLMPMFIIYKYIAIQCNRPEQAQAILGIILIVTFWNIHIRQGEPRSARLIGQSMCVAYYSHKGSI
jgi:hypothetical protein